MSPTQPRFQMPVRRRLHLPGRGTTTIRELEGPRNAPTLMLLHGLGATGGLNWGRSFAALADAYRVVAIDHRGHGGGIRCRESFRLADCADDVVAAADQLGIERFVAVGYSMGGPISQLTWYRHRERVAGLVLCATSRHFLRRELQRPLRFVLGPGVRVAGMGPDLWSENLRTRLLASIADPRGRAFVEEELSGHEHRKVLEAMAAVLRFSSHDWIGRVDVPTSVVVTTRDQLVAPKWQYGLASSIPGAKVHEVEADHYMAPASSRFARALREACDDVVRRAGAQGSPLRRSANG